MDAEEWEGLSDGGGPLDLSVRRVTMTNGVLQQQRHVRLIDGLGFYSTLRGIDPPGLRLWLAAKEE